MVDHVLILRTASRQLHGPLRPLLAVGDLTPSGPGVCSAAPPREKAELNGASIREVSSYLRHAADARPSLQRSRAKNASALIEHTADQEGDRLDQQAAALKNQAKQAGGLSGERMKVRAEDAAKEARLVRKQADMQADAVKEAADAKVKAIKSR